MGGRPVAALNLVGFPDAALEASVLGDILRGGADKAREAGIDIVGGHTIKTDEPIYGLAVTGLVHPKRMVTNAGGRPGDTLVLTKPLGLGIITTAAKQDADSRGAIARAIELMATLNRGACEAMLNVGVHAATDVTGFGLLGHLRNLTKASGCSATVWVGRVPVLEAAWTYVARGHRSRRHARQPALPGRAASSTAPEVDEAGAAGALRCADERGPAHRRGAGAGPIALVDVLERAGTPCAAVVGRIDAGAAGTARVGRRA